jgi:dCMP deaminase
MDECMCIHAEENAILEAGYQKCEGGTIYSTMYPCLFCAKSIVQVGIKRVVYAKEFFGTERSAQLFADAGVEVVKHSTTLTPCSLSRVSFGRLVN